jgi:hypothetical protein
MGTAGSHIAGRSRLAGGSVEYTVAVRAAFLSLHVPNGTRTSPVPHLAFDAGPAEFLSAKARL